MGHATVPVDLFNPGQVFACYGLLEAAEVLLGDARGGFDWSDATQARFHLSADRDSNPVHVVLDFLATATVVSLVPPGSGHRTEKWNVPSTLVPSGAAYPIPEPDSPATLPALLCSGDQCLVLDHWGDATQRDNVKFWAGAGGYPGVALLRDALGLISSRIGAAAEDPFSLAATQSSSFRFDWRRDYVPMEIGFSLNAHSSFEPRGYPLVEVLAAIGMSNARPARLDKLAYRYQVLCGEDLPLPLLRAGLGGAPLPFPSRRFRAQLMWPGKEGQSRCITNVTEENSP